MLIIGTRRVLKALRVSIAEGKDVIDFKKGEIVGKVTIEPYKGVIGVSVMMWGKSSPEIIEENYGDIVFSKSANVNMSSIQKMIDRLYGLCEIGLYIQYGLYNNSLPKCLYLDNIMEYFGAEGVDVEVGSYKYGKEKLSFRGQYYGDKVVTVIRSKRTNHISEILRIEDVSPPTFLKLF